MSNPLARYALVVLVLAAALLITQAVWAAAIDGQTLADQPAEVQRIYRSLYGGQAETVWDRDHNRELGARPDDPCGFVPWTGATVARDGLTLASQPEWIQELFRLTWPAMPEARWAWEHDCDLGPTPTPTAAPTPTPTETPEATPTPTAAPTPTRGAFWPAADWHGLCALFFAYDPRVPPTGSYASPPENEYLDHPDPTRSERCQRRAIA